MAEEVLVKEQLSDKMILAGKQIVDELKASDVELMGAFWLYVPERNEWQLILATPKVEVEGPREVFARVQWVLENTDTNLHGLRLSDIGLLGPNNTLAKAIDSLPFLPLASPRLTRAWLNGAYVEDIYFYFFKDKINFLVVADPTGTISINVRQELPSNPDE